MPSPITSASRMAHASPVPAHTWFGLDGATAREPIALDRLAVEHRLECLRAIRRLPDPARSRARVVGLGVAGNPGNRREAPGARGADVSKPQRLHRLLGRRATRPLGVQRGGPEQGEACAGQTNRETIERRMMTSCAGQYKRNAECRMQNAKCRVQSAECRKRSTRRGMQNAECKVQNAGRRVRRGAQNAECKMQSAECRLSYRPARRYHAAHWRSS